MDDSASLHTDFAVDQIVTVFRSRLAPGALAAGYPALAEEMVALARSLPGLVDVKTFSAADGERVTVATFANQASHDAWRSHPDHVAAQRRGRIELYESFTTQVCRTIRVGSSTRASPDGA